MRNDRSKWFLAVAILPTLCMAAQDASPKPDPFETARATAKAEGRYLLVAVYEHDCPDCNEFDSTTLKDSRVTGWVGDRAVLLKLSTDDATGANFARAHKVETFPTLLIMTSDARELGRQVGVPGAARLMLRINAVTKSDKIRGKPGLHSWAGEDVVLAAVDKAIKLTGQKEYQGALDQFVWAIEHRASRSPVFLVQHLPKLLEAWSTLAKQFPPAKEDLLRRVVAAERATVKTKRVDTYSLYLIKYGYGSLGQEEALIRHYDRLKRLQPRGVNVTAFARLIYEPLLNARRYKDIAFSVETPEDVTVYLDESRRVQRPLAEVRHRLAARYEVLLGLGEFKEAESVADQLLSYDATPDAYVALAESAFRSKHSTYRDVDRTRKAFAVTGGKNADVVIALAKLLAKQFDDSTEAVMMLEQGIKDIKSPKAVAKLRACLNDVRSGVIKPKKREPLAASPKKSSSK
jgi:tetratricopeptide (TPR) repeat protein